MGGAGERRGRAAGADDAPRAAADGASQPAQPLGSGREQSAENGALLGPQVWIDWSEVRSTILGWTGYKLLAVERTL